MAFIKNYTITNILFIAISALTLGMLACEGPPMDNKTDNKNFNNKGISKAKEKEKALPLGMVLIPAGEFIFGNDNPDLSAIPFQLQNIRKWGEDQKPEKIINLPTFLIDQYEVTNEQYIKFNQNYLFPLGNHQNPAVNISWFSAKAYCGSLGKRLPTEMEWEKAARGPEGHSFPWGNTFDPKKANTGFSKLSSSSPVGTFPGDVGYYTVYDMAGNASEWTSSWYLPYEGSIYKSSNFGKTYKVTRGGSFQDMGHYELEIFSTTTFRYFNKPEEWAGDTGFRCAKDANERKEN